MSLDVYLELDDGEVYTGNITHNLSKMAREVRLKEHSLYMYLWRPDEIGVTHARQLVRPLKIGLMMLQFNSDYYRQWNPENGWGNYETLVQFTEEYLAACEMWPDAKVIIWR